jgi:hypothetical protein
MKNKHFYVKVIGPEELSFAQFTEDFDDVKGEALFGFIRERNT